MWLDRHTSRLAVLSEEFKAASPFPHVVIDNFLEPEMASSVLREFPADKAMPKSRDYIFGSKKELSSVAEQGDSCARLVELLLAPEFAWFISALTGRELFVDPAFHGGGFHQGINGSFLDMHVDFNVHPLHADWLRVLNILIYLNPDWQDSYDGNLLIVSNPGQPPKEIAPLFNRAVIMLTDETTFHGYRRMSLPDNVARRSVATYAYEKVEAGSVQGRTTGWVASEEDGSFKKFAARHYDSAVRAKNKLFGSATAKNR